MPRTAGDIGLLEKAGAEFGHVFVCESPLLGSDILGSHKAKCKGLNDDSPTATSSLAVLGPNYY